MDFLDHHHNVSTGEYMLYRNYFVLDQFDQLMYKYAEHPGSDERAKTSLYDTPPVARGFSAFYAHWLQPDQILPEALMNITYLDPPEYYEVYLKSAFKVFMLRNERSPNPLSRVEIKSKFFPEHIQREKTWFEQSHKFYSQCKDEEDQAFKDKLQADFNGYMAWLKEKAKLPFPTHVLSLQPSPTKNFSLQNSERDLMLNKFLHESFHNSLLSENETKTKSRPGPKPQNKKPKIEYRKLHDLWLGTEKQYDEAIHMLTTFRISISEIAFVIQRTDGLHWQYPHKYGRDQYMKGFIYTCLKRNLIANQTSIVFTRVLSNTFSITIRNNDAFKSVIVNPPPDKYLTPFKTLPYSK